MRGASDLNTVLRVVELLSSDPTREARVEVKEVPGSPGSYSAVAHLRPWLQFEELTTSMRLVARIPTAA